MAGVRFTDLQSRPSRPRSKSVWPHGGWMGNRGPRAGLPSTQTAPSQHQKTGFCSSWPTSKPMPFRWCTGAYSAWSRAKRIRGPRPVPGVARGAARPWRCPCPLPLGSGPASRCLRGRRRSYGRPAGGGARPCGSHPSRRAGLPPCAHDGTEPRRKRNKNSECRLLRRSSSS